MKNAIKAVKKILQPFYVAYHDYWYNRRYHAWLKKGPDKEVLDSKAYDLPQNPLISIVVPAYDTNEIFFREMIESVLAQAYENWELILVDDSSPNQRVRELIAEYAEKDQRIKYEFLRRNMGISGATNEAIKLSSGEFVALFDHDDVLHPEALFEVVKVLNDNRNIDFIYTDEDKVTESGVRHQPFCKPGWNKDFLYSVNYITHFTAIRKSVLEKIGYENSKYDGAQDWELFLRCTRNISPERIHHIPKILYSWRVHELSTAKDLGVKPYVRDAQKRAIEDDLMAQGYKDFVVTLDSAYPGQWQVKFRAVSSPPITILVSGSLNFTHVVHEIKSKTSYKNYKIIRLDEYVGIGRNKEIKDEYLVFVYDNVAIHNRDWLQDLLGDAERRDIGFVQAELSSVTAVMKNIATILDPNAIELVGKMSRRNVAKHLYLTSRYNIRTLYRGVSMIEESKLNNAYNGSIENFDIKEASEALHQKGYRNLYTPYVKVLK